MMLCMRRHSNVLGTAAERSVTREDSVITTPPIVEPSSEGSQEHPFNLLPVNIRSCEFWSFFQGRWSEWQHFSPQEKWRHMQAREVWAMAAAQRILQVKQAPLFRGRNPTPSLLLFSKWNQSWTSPMTTANFSVFELWSQNISVTTKLVGPINDDPSYPARGKLKYYLVNNKIVSTAIASLTLAVSLCW
jgi:hypothetical protein